MSVSGETREKNKNEQTLMNLNTKIKQVITIKILTD